MDRDRAETHSAAKGFEMYCPLHFRGYWPVPSAGVAPFSGIYCVYAFTWPNLFSLLYIGEANDVETRVARHERRRDWGVQAKSRPLYFSAATAAASYRKQAEAAMIRRHQPPCNIEYRNDFPFTATHIVTSGQNVGLVQSFEVQTDRPWATQARA